MIMPPISIIEIGKFLGFRSNAAMRLFIVQFISSNALLSRDNYFGDDYFRTGSILRLTDSCLMSMRDENVLSSALRNGNE